MVGGVRAGGAKRIYTAQSRWDDRDEDAAASGVARDAQNAHRKATSMIPQGYQKTKASLPAIRQVWAAVTRQPGAAIREIGEACDLPTITVGRALYDLREAGYVEFDTATSRARAVRVPLYERLLAKPPRGR